MINRNSSSTILGRLYIQSDEIASKILAEINPDDLDFGPVLASLAFPDVQIFDSLDKMEEFSEAVKKHLESSCKSLDPLYCIPVLISAFSRFYEEMHFRKSNLPVVACKLMISFIWSSTYSAKTPTSRSFTSLLYALKIAILFSNLDQVINIWRFSVNGKVEVNSKGVFALESLAGYAINFNSLGPHDFKVLEAAVENIWSDENSFEKVQNILTGKVKLGEKLFGDSFLSDIPFQETEFWANLWCKFRIYLLIIKERHIVAGQAFGGVCLLTERVKVIREKSGNLLQSMNENNFWQPTWHKIKMGDEISEIKRMVVDRPMIGIYEPEPVYATSIAFLWDSINVLLEEFVHSKKGNKIYERYFSGPFETTTLELFRKYGFECGEVNTNSMWKTVHPIKLETAEKIPGQIDILAISDQHRLIVVADCKMVHFPNKLNAQKNLLGKFGAADNEGFFKKLNRKTEWFGSCNNFNLEDYNILKILITNIKIPIPGDEERLVLSIDEVEERLLLVLRPHS